VDVAAQRRLKGMVVAEQLRRLAGVDREVEVEAIPGDEDGLRWRTRMRFHRTADGGLGLRKHRSSEIVPIGDCRIQAPEATVLVEGEPAPADTLFAQVAGHRFEVAADGFWQVHRGAPTALVDAVIAAAGLRPGDRVADLYSGVGLFSAFLAEAVGPQGSVVAVEGHRRAAELAEANLAAYPWVRTVRGAVDTVVATLGGCDVVLLDPPRDGARRQVVGQVVGLSPRTVVYVACDPASFARDVGLFAESGYGLDRLRAFDLFPMTHHVEVVGVLSKMT
jgi:tRNA/tmRNA/rRNA uracil-C5-methylase (TrmA/RlmC/RlmD family)